MTKINTLQLAVGLVVWLSTQSASAGMKTIEARQHPPGSNVSHALPGATLSAIVNYTPPGGPKVVGVSKVTTVACTATAEAPICTPGSRLFTPLNPPAGAPSGIYPWFFEDVGVMNCVINQTLLTTCPFQFSLIKISFATPTHFVQATWQTENDLSSIFAFDASNQLVAYCLNGPAGCVTLQTSNISGFVKAGVVSLLISNNTIATVYVGGWTSFTGIDSLSYDQD